MQDGGGVVFGPSEAAPRPGPLFYRQNTPLKRRDAQALAEFRAKAQAPKIVFNSNKIE